MYVGGRSAAEMIRIVGPGCEVGSCKNLAGVDQPAGFLQESATWAPLPLPQPDFLIATDQAGRLGTNKFGYGAVLHAASIQTPGGRQFFSRCFPLSPSSGSARKAPLSGPIFESAQILRAPRRLQRIRGDQLEHMGGRGGVCLRRLLAFSLPALWWVLHCSEQRLVGPPPAPRRDAD